MSNGIICYSIDDKSLRLQFRCQMASKLYSKAALNLN